MDHYSNLPHSALYYEWNVYKHLLSNSLLAFTWTANVLPYLCKHLNVLHNCLHNTKSFASHHQLSQRFPPAITSLVWMSTRKAGDIRSEWQGRCVCPIVGSESSAHKSQFKRSSVPAIDFACWLGTMAISAILVPGHTGSGMPERTLSWPSMFAFRRQRRAFKHRSGPNLSWSHRCLTKSKRSPCPSPSLTRRFQSQPAYLPGRVLLAQSSSPHPLLGFSHLLQWMEMRAYPWDI